MCKLVNFASALLLGFVVATAFNGQNAVAQGHDLETFFNSLFVAPVVEGSEQARKEELGLRLVHDAFSRAVSDLQSENARGFLTSRSLLLVHARTAFSRTEKKLAEYYLSLLPSRLAKGYACLSFDGCNATGGGAAR